MKRKPLITTVFFAGAAVLLLCFGVLRSDRFRGIATAESQGTNLSAAAHSADRMARRQSRDHERQIEPTTDVQSLLDGVADTPLPSSAAFDELIKRVDRRDIAAAIASAETTLTPDMRRRFVIGLLTRLAQQEPSAAIELATQLKPESGRSEAVEKVFLSWMESSPADARSWAQTSMSHGLMEAADAASNPADDRDREAPAVSVAKAWATKDPASAVEWVKQFPDSHERILALENIFHSWAALDVTKAVTALGSISDSALRARLSEQVAAEWAKKDANAALAWAQSLPDDAGRSEVARRVLLALSVSNPAQALQHAMNLEPGDDTSQTVNMLLQQWAARDVNSAVQWLRALPDGEQRDAALSDLLPTWAANRPDAAAAEVLQLAEGERKTEMLDTVATRWAEKDPVAAMTWVLQTMDGAHLRESVIQSVITQWSGQDSGALGAWLNTVPQGPFRDVSVAAFARNIGFSDPQSALRWAASISDASRRSEVTEAIASSWLERGGASARNELAKVDLPAELRDKLLQK